MLFEAFTAGLGGYSDVEYSGWTPEEAHHVELLILEGFLAKEHVTDVPWLGHGEGETYAETYIYLTPAGYDWFENRGLFKAFLNNVRKNTPTVVVSVIIALASAWLLKLVGFSK